MIMFIQVIQGPVADEAGLRAAFDSWPRELGQGAEGWLGSTGGVTDDGQFIMLAQFDSPEAAAHNSQRPEQGEWWSRTASMFAGDVTFHDCVDAYTFAAHDMPDEKAPGFVQVMQGTVFDPDRMRELTEQFAAGLGEYRPDILGGMVAVDGGEHTMAAHFTEAVSFTNEREARVGEGAPPSAKLRALMEAEQGIMDDITYYDLRHPWVMTPIR
jgi:hypothetical protein